MGRSPATAVAQHWDAPWFRQWRGQAPCQLTFYWRNLKALNFNLYAWDIVLTTQGENLFIDKVFTFLYPSWHTNRTSNLWNPAETSMEGFRSQTGKSKVVFGGSSWNGKQGRAYWETTATSLKLINPLCRCNSKQKANHARQPPEASVLHSNREAHEALRTTSNSQEGTQRVCGGGNWSLTLRNLLTKACDPM